MIYLDHNASTPVDPEVSDAVFSSLKREFANPSSSHAAGQRARAAIVAARRDIADFLGCLPEEIIFTSGGTESNNLALRGQSGRHPRGHIIISAIEHPSIANVCRQLVKQGIAVTSIGTDRQGIIDIGRLEKAVTGATFLISVMHANNETGVLQPVGDIGRIARRRGILFHIDAAQTIGKIPLSLSDIPCDMLTVAAHKFYGPKGIGALYIRKGVSLDPVLFGAGHEQGLRPGTENVAGIVGLAAACRIAGRDLKSRVAHTSRLCVQLYDLLREAIPSLTLNGHPELRLPNTLNVCIPGVLSHALVKALGDTVAISSGSACHADRVAPSTVLTSMGLTDEEALSSVRISLGKDTTEDEVREASVRIADAVASLRRDKEG